jgi:type IX secretion system PorP/SprF family membrane protein
MKKENNKHMKKVIFLLSILMATLMTQAQQLSLYSQYMNDDFLLNPAVAGTKSYNPISSTFRKQWAGIDGAPVTQSISFHAFAGKNVGLGGYVFNDVSGPTRRSGLNFSMSYHIRLSPDNNQKLALGLSALLFQNVFDATTLTTDIPDDQAILNAHGNVLSPDANFGVYYFNEDKYYAGVSVHHLIQSEVDLFNTLENINNPVERSYFLTGGYRFELGENFDLTPSVLLRYMESNPFQVDGNLNLTFKKLVWIAASYRYNDAVVGMIGFHKKMFSVGYSYDYSISDIQSYSAGSHELFLSIRLNRKDNDRNRIPWSQRNRLFE